MIRSRLPPSESRTAISRRRAAALANRRLPMLAQASSKTSVTAKNSVRIMGTTCRFLRGPSIQDVPAAMIWGRCLSIWLFVRN